MAGSINFRISTSVLVWARVSMGYSLEQAAKKAGVPKERYESWEKGEKLPTYKQLEDLAEKVFKRPLAILLLKTPPSENPIQKDFRNLTNSELSELSAELRIALRRAKRYQLILEEVASGQEPGRFKNFKISKKVNPVEASKQFRDFLGVTLQEQKSWKPDSAFSQFRQLVESIGMYVFLSKFPMNEARAFCMAGNFPLIVLNTDDSKNGRIFSLFHEVCHVLFNENDVFKDINSGVLNKEYREIERFCNLFASSFLVPDEYFDQDIVSFNINSNEVRDNQITKLALLYNVSSEVIARKLLDRHILTEDVFWSKKRRWDSIARAAKEKENKKRKDQDEHGINQGIKVVNEKGRPYVSSVVNAYQQGLISSSDLTNFLEVKFNHLPKILERLA